MVVRNPRGANTIASSNLITVLLSPSVMWSDPRQRPPRRGTQLDGSKTLSGRRLRGFVNSIRFSGYFLRLTLLSRVWTVLAMTELPRST